MSLLSLGRDYALSSVRRPPPPGAPPPAQPPRPQDNFEGLTKYIPVETITLFVAAVSALTSLYPQPLKDEVVAPPLYWAAYGLCGMLTPLILWIGALVGHRKSGAVGAPAIPWWRMIAATVAFGVWSLSVPPMLPVGWRMIFGVVALFVSTVLALFDPLFDTPKTPAVPQPAGGS